MTRNNIPLLLTLAFVLMIGCMEESQPSLEVEVLDENGMAAAGARVILHLDRLEWADYANPVTDAYTDANGRAVLEVLENGRYFVNIIQGEKNNRFGKKRTGQRLESGMMVTEQFTIRPPSDWERILSGGDHLVWTLAPLMTPDGTQFLDYPVDTDMFIDGRWLDSNGRLGLWWFNENRTKIFYDYATSGAVVESRMISLTEELFRAEIDFFGIRMLIEMYPE